MTSCRRTCGWALRRDDRQRDRPVAARQPARMSKGSVSEYKKRTTALPTGTPCGMPGRVKRRAALRLGTPRRWRDASGPVAEAAGGGLRAGQGGARPLAGRRPSSTSVAVSDFEAALLLLVMLPFVCALLIWQPQQPEGGEGIEFLLPLFYLIRAGFSDHRSLFSFIFPE